MINIVSCFWNAEKFIEKCIASVKIQSFSSFKMYLIDDVSSDGTVEKIKNLIHGDERFVLIENKSKKYKIKNIDDLINNESLISDEDIIIELDGDDCLFNKDVLFRINQEYLSDENLWLTNGSFIFSSGEMGFSGKANPSNIRNESFSFSHLRTWKAHLWKKIKKEDFLNNFGDIIINAPDLAYSFPMAEMAANGHYKFIPDILYIYNNESPYNEFKEESAGGGRFYQIQSEMEIRAKQPYSPH
jgi:glycosyltransferase involved in cell wall biosynthesis